MVHGLVESGPVPRSSLAQPPTPGAVGGATVGLAGGYRHRSGFSLNGIDATRNGGTLVVVQSSSGTLFTVTPGGVTREISLGGITVTNGDGLLLDGRTLYVVQNRLNRIAVIALSANLRTGRAVRTITSPGFDVPTTIDDLDRRLYAVNARFGTAPGPTTDYWAHAGQEVAPRGRALPGRAPKRASARTKSEQSRGQRPTLLG